MKNKTIHRALYFILNDKAKKDLKLNEALESIAPEVKSIKRDYFHQYKSIQECVREGIKENCDVVIATGGDGTLNAVADAYIHLWPESKNLSIGILPYGTANDFATALGYDPNEPLKNIKHVLSCQPKKIDVGMVNGRCFVNAATGGIGAEITHETPKPLKALFGPLAYFLKAITKLHNLDHHEAVVSADDFHWEGKLMSIGVANGKQTGGGITISAKADFTDGKLNVVIVPEMGVIELTALLAESKKEKPNFEEFNVKELKTEKLLLDTKTEFQINLDGEPIKGRHFEFTLAKARIPFCGADAIQNKN